MKKYAYALLIIGTMNSFSLEAGGNQSTAQKPIKTQAATHVEGDEYLLINSPTKQQKKKKEKRNKKH